MKLLPYIYIFIKTNLQSDVLLLLTAVMLIKIFKKTARSNDVCTRCFFLSNSSYEGSTLINQPNLTAVLTRPFGIMSVCYYVYYNALLSSF